MNKQELFRIMDEYIQEIGEDLCGMDIIYAAKVEGRSQVLFMLDSLNNENESDPKLDEAKRKKFLDDAKASTKNWMLTQMLKRR